MGPLKTLNLSNAVNGLINSGRNTKESLLMTFGIGLLTPGQDAFAQSQFAFAQSKFR